jgi:hypothetical protein
LLSGNRSASSATLTASFEESERRALALRVSSSRHFAKAHQLQDILLYLIDRALQEPSAAIHEHEIACTVLGRKPDFNPHEDNIVRVQVSHLRKRLDEYFAAEGINEKIRISVPRGGYALRFESRSVTPEPATVYPAVEAKPERRRVFFPAAAFTVLILAAACAYLWWPLPARNHIPEDDLLWPRIFAGQNTNIVVADTCLVMLQDILDTDIQLSGYLDGQYPGSLLDKVPDQALQNALRRISTRQYTSLADLNSTQRLSELSHRYTPNPPAIRYARHMNVRDFKTGNFIMLGSRRGIPWVRLFDSQLNFSMEEERRTKSFYFRNKTPRPGEPGAWRQQANADTTVETYADIALLPNLGNTGQVLILSGIGMAASEAAAEFLAGPEFQKALSGILPKSGNRSQLRYFELLLRTRAVAGAANSSQVVGSRVLATPFTGY